MMKRLARISLDTVFAVTVLALVIALLPGVAGAKDAVSQQMLMGKLKWRSVGPYIGGRVVAVDGVASNPDLFYMGAVDGGVWK
ncbi:MAG: hypothetical protein ACREPU_10470, partial [Rhodanobacteraceae bacterium]